MVNIIFTTWNKIINTDRILALDFSNAIDEKVNNYSFIIETLIRKYKGDICKHINTCKKGYTCVVPGTDNTASQRCGYICDLSGAGSPGCNDAGGPGAEYVCIALNKIGGAHFPDKLGVCINCDNFPSAPFCEWAKHWSIQNYQNRINFGSG